MRHGHACSALSSKTDHKRKLDDTGIRQVLIIGKKMITAEVFPDYLICSDALRAVQSAEIIKDTLELNLEIKTNSELYSASPELYAKILQYIPDIYSSVMIIAHNPVMEEVVSLLTGERKGMGTANLFTMDLNIVRWQNFALDGSVTSSARLKP